VAFRDAPDWTCLAVFTTAGLVRAAASGLTRADGRFLGPATCGVIVRLQRGRASE
jgi:hypothetical protein